MRTLARLFVTRRKLLEWETAASTEQRLGTGLVHFVSSMWPAPALAIAIGALVVVLRPGASGGGPVPGRLVPLARRGLPGQSARRSTAVSDLTDEDRRALRRIARKTWLFFETFVGDADHWLPPDNFQEVPDGRIAHRTSPTNRACCCSRPWPPTTWATSAWAAWSTGSSRRSTRLTGWRSTGATSTTGTRRGPSSRFRRIHLDGRQRQLAGLPGRAQARAPGESRRAVLGPAVIQGWPTRSRWSATRRSDDWRAGSALLEQPPGNLAEWASGWRRSKAEAVDLGRPHPGSRCRRRRAVATRRAWAERLVGQIRAWRAELAAMAPWLGRSCEPAIAWMTRPGRPSKPARVLGRDPRLSC